MKRTSPDRTLLVALRALSALTGSIVVLIVLFLVVEAIPGLTRVNPGRFVSDPGWHPSAEPGEFNILPMVAATLTTTFGAVLLAAPIGILAALFCRFFVGHSVRRLFRGLVELLAGIPSVVFGFWGLVTLVPLVRELAPPGPSLLAGILVLALMIVPTITLLSLAAFDSVPHTHIQGAAALGLTRWTTVRGVVFPHARAGIGIAVILGTMRAVGETMAVLMVCGNVTRMPTSLFDPVRTLTANIALELGYASSEHRAVLFVSGLALMIVVAILVWIQDRFQRSVAHG